MVARVEGGRTAMSDGGLGVALGCQPGRCGLSGVYRHRSSVGQLTHRHAMARRVEREGCCRDGLSVRAAIGAAGVVGGGGATGRMGMSGRNEPGGMDRRRVWAVWVCRVTGRAQRAVDRMCNGTQREVDRTGARAGRVVARAGMPGAVVGMGCRRGVVSGGSSRGRVWNGSSLGACRAARLGAGLSAGGWEARAGHGKSRAWGGVAGYGLSVG